MVEVFKLDCRSILVEAPLIRFTEISQAIVIKLKYDIIGRTVCRCKIYHVTRYRLMVMADYLADYVFSVRERLACVVCAYLSMHYLL